MKSLHAKVLIVGGGPVGLSLAIELGTNGIDTLLIDRRDGSTPLPRMNGVNARSMELCRRWGIAQRVRDAGFPRDYPVRMLIATSVRGHEFSRFDRGSALTRPPSTTTPEPFQRCPQTWFDPILRAHAETLPSNAVRYQTRLDDFIQDEKSVRAEVTNLVDGARYTVEADYMVGCDGSASGVREALSVCADGNSILSQELNVYFESDHVFTDAEDRRSAMIWLIGPRGVWAALAAIDGRRQWRLWLTNVPPGTDLDNFDGHELVRAALGADVPFRITGYLPWARPQRVARKFRKGRVFLAGDAAHTLTPTGGFGMNCGIVDAVDLGWKLAGVYKGWADSKILDSYEFERRPAAMRTVDEATHTYGLLAALPRLPCVCDDGPDGERDRERVRAVVAAGQYDREYRNEGIVLGMRYDPSPIIIPDGTDAPQDVVMQYTPNARPGSRAPHAWLADGRSTLDLFRNGFVLLRLGAEVPACTALAAAARQRGVPLEIVQLNESEVRELYAAPLVLVRPDGHVAWRSHAEPADAAAAMAIIDTIRGATPREVRATGPAIYCQPPGRVSAN